MKTISYRSAFRNARAPVSSTRVPAVDSPVGPDSTSVGMRSPKAQQQAKTLRQPPPPDAWDSLPSDLRQSLLSGYDTGGFEGVVKAAGHDWYDIPEHLRTQILSRLQGGQ